MFLPTKVQGVKFFSIEEFAHLGDVAFPQELWQKYLFRKQHLVVYHFSVLSANCMHTNTLIS